MKKSKIKALASVASLAAVASFGAILCACDDDTPPQPVPGPETGEYYCEVSPNSEYTLTLSEGTKLTLEADQTFNGSYTVGDGGLTFKYGSVQVTADYDGNKITFTYNDDTLTFWRDVNYTVTFDGNGGATQTRSVRNGKTIERPTDPEYTGHGFIGWYSDKSGTALYDFGAAVTSDVTVYAKWAAKSDREYSVAFDLGYDGAPEIAGKTTIGNRLYNVPEPKRDGYAFRGWWISQYDDGEKLSYAYDGVVEIMQDLTLYALWQKDGEAGDPNVNVTAAGVVWDRLTTSAYIKVTGPDGFDTIEHSVGMTVRNEMIAFAEKPAGDYVIELTVGGKTYTRYYKNKALAAVSGIRVTDDRKLVFDSVDNAERYYITVDCGDPLHKHTMLDIGNVTSYDFSSCEMKPEGITFSVSAAADGYAASTARTLVYEAHLDAVSGYVYEEETGVLTWAPVDHATNYKVIVNGGAPTDTNSKTSVDLRKYSGVVTVSVYAEAHGYNSVGATTYIRPSRPVGMPTNVKINGTTLRWNEAAEAQSYVVTINGKEYKVENKATSLDLADCGLGLIDGETYTITVQGVSEDGASRSYKSDTLTAKYNAMGAKLGYEASELTWDHVIGATEYEVQVNDGDILRVEAGTNRAEITLTAKINTLRVRSRLSSGYSDWVTLDVRAYEISFDSQSGLKVDSIYKADGDKLSLPEATRHGYTFSSWYDAPLNGVRYDAAVFDGSDDITLYAAWTANTYNVKLDYGTYGEGSVNSASITYDGSYSLPVPTIKNKKYLFVGWSATADGNGAVYTDCFGTSLAGWNNATEGLTLHAFYAEAFDFVEDGDGYAVMKGRAISAVENLVIPSEYNGKKVVSLNENAFQNGTFKYVTIPDTVRTIPETAFDGCNRIVRFSVDVTGEPDPVFIGDPSGTLLMDNIITGAREIAFVPATITGEYSVPYGVTRISTKAFKGSKLTKINIPTTVTEIATDAFVNCSALTTVNFLPAVKGEAEKPLRMSPDAINPESCKALTTINLPARTADFVLGAASVFVRYKNLKEINVEDGNNLFYASDRGMLLNANKSELLFCPFASEVTKYTVPSSVLRIADNAFNRHLIAKPGNSDKKQMLSEIVFHGGMTYIGERAFYMSTSLTKATFGASSRPSGLAIGKDAFYQCKKLATVDFREAGELKQKTVGGKTTYVYEYTQSCGVESLGDNAFYNCAIQGVVLPSTLKTIGSKAFAENGPLTSLDLGHINADLRFGDYVFQKCSNLVSVEITDNVGAMEFNSVFNDCGVKSFTVSDRNPNYEAGDDGVLYNAGKTAVVYYPAGLDGTYTFPSTVTRIGGGVFKGVKNIVNLTVPDSVTEIAASAFENCTNLETLTFAEDTSQAASSLTIGDNAFKGCSKLKVVALPLRTTSLGANCFSGLALTSVTLNEGLQTIGASAFYNTKSLASITVPSTVTSIGSSAFKDSALSEITFARSENAKSLSFGISVFNGCTNLTEIELPERLTDIPESAFSGCTKLETVNVPTTVANRDGKRGVGDKAFLGCTQLSTLTFAKGGSLPLSFGNATFGNCPELTRLELPNRIVGFSNNYDVFQMGSKGASASNIVTSFDKTIPQYANYEDLYIQEIVVEAGCKDFASFDGLLYTAGLKEVVYCPQGKAGVVTISKNAQTIRPAAFAIARKITKVVFEDKDNTELDDFYLQDTDDQYGSVFYGCISLTEIEFPARLTRLGNNALYRNMLQHSSVGGVNVYNSAHIIETVTFADGCRLTEIGDKAFGQTLITNLVLPSMVTTIGDMPFYDYKGGELTITVSPVMDADAVAAILKNSTKTPTQPDLIIPEGSLLVRDSGIVYANENGKRVIAYCEADAAGVEAGSETLAIPADVTKISAGAFKNIKRFGKVEFQKPAEGESEVDLTICANAFYGSGITEIELPARLKSLETDVFNSCKSLTTVTFEQGYSYAAIPDNMFKDCSELTAVAVPDCVTSIGRSFERCKKLESVTFTDNSNLLTIDGFAFGSCTMLKSFELPATVTALTTSTYGSAFNGCKALETFTFKGNKITELPTDTFYNCTKLNNLILPSSLTSIGNTVFKGCTGLTSITIPKNVRTIGTSAFEGCTNLGTLAFETDSAITSLGDKAFYNTGLITLSVPDSVVEAGGSVFSGCTALNTVVFGRRSGLQTLSKNMFNGCTSLTKVVLPGFISAIGSSAFNGCTNLSEVDFNGNTGLQSVESGAFGKCTSLTSIKFPDSVTVIESSVFSGCTGLTEFVFPSGVTSVSNSLFFGCTNLVKVTLPADITEVLQLAFSGCTKLTTIVGNPCFTTELPAAGAPVPQSSLTRIGYEVFKTCPALPNIYVVMAAPVSGSENSIGGGAFWSCTSLKKAVLVNVTYLGNCAFQNCQALQEVSLPDCLRYLGEKNIDVGSNKNLGYVFKDCKSLKAIALPQSINVIHPSMFENCTELTSVSFYNITGIGKDAFKNCANLVGASYLGTGGDITYIDGALYIGTKLVKYFGATDGSGNPLDTLTVADGTTEIDQYALQNASALKTPAGLKKLGIYAFDGCTSLESINLDGVTSIGNYAFQNCGKLSGVKLSFGSTVGSGAFKNCTSLTSIDFSGVLSIGGNSFENTSLTQVVIPESLEIKGSAVFKGCTKLVKAELHAAVPGSFLGSFFQNCTALASVELNDKITELGSSMFDGCASLKAIEIPASVTKINMFAFKNCTGIKAILVGANVTTVSSNAFQGWTAEQTVYTPHASKPSGWNASWMGSGGKVNVVWGYTGSTLPEEGGEQTPEVSE